MSLGYFDNYSFLSSLLVTMNIDRLSATVYFFVLLSCGNTYTFLVSQNSSRVTHQYNLALQALDKLPRMGRAAAKEGPLLDASVTSASNTGMFLPGDDLVLVAMLALRLLPTMAFVHFRLGTGNLYKGDLAFANATTFLQLIAYLNMLNETIFRLALFIGVTFGANTLTFSHRNLFATFTMIQPMLYTEKFLVTTEMITA